MIRRGEFKPGEWLRQDELASGLVVGIMSIWQALRRLEAEVLVVFFPRRGARVAQLDVFEFEELYMIREELAVLACR